MTAIDAPGTGVDRSPRVRRRGRALCDTSSSPGRARSGRAGGPGRVRVAEEHRLIYKVVDDEVRIGDCRYDYGR
ncbi:type II toxin-antitoxin system YoeB family toxin [Streptomyces sp. NBC_01411]